MMTCRLPISALIALISLYYSPVAGAVSFKILQQQQPSYLRSPATESPLALRPSSRFPAALNDNPPPGAPQPHTLETTLGLALNTSLSDVADILKCTSSLPVHKKAQWVVRSEIGMNRNFPITMGSGLTLTPTPLSEVQLWTSLSYSHVQWNLKFSL